MLSLIVTQNMLVYGIVVVKGDGNNCTLCEVCVHAQPVSWCRALYKVKHVLDVYIHTYSFVCCKVSNNTLYRFVAHAGDTS